MRVAFLLLHDQRFSGWQLSEFLFSRYHFAKEYAKKMSEFGNETFLYIMHEKVKEIKEYSLDGYTVRVLPVKFRFPPFVPIGNSHNFHIVKELSEGSFDIVHFHNYYFWSFIPVALAKKFRKWKIVGQYHGEPELRVLGKLVHSPWLQVIDKFLVSTHEEIDRLCRLFVNSRKILKFPNVGVDTNCFQKKCAYEEIPHFIYVGRMTHRPRSMKEKNPWMVLEIAKKLKGYVDSFKILMVGDGPGLEELKSYSEKMNLPNNVKFLGYKPHDQLPSLYSKCLLSFVPLSMWDLDPFWDGALKESLACETPVAGFNSTIRDHAQAKRKFGLLLPPSPDKAAKLLSVLMRDRKYLREAGRRGKTFVERHCSWGRVIGSLLEVYRNLK